MLIPIPATDEQAKAVTAVADLGRTVVQEVGDLARAIGRVVGTSAEDAVGLTIGDPLRYLRTKQALKYQEKVAAIHAQRGVTVTEAVSLSLALPLLSSAYDESRTELQDMWAALIAAAMDPTRSDRVRLSFVEALKKFDPLDAVVLTERSKHTGALSPDALTFITTALGRRREDIIVSAVNLGRLGCVVLPGENVNIFNATVFGRELIRACSP